MKLGFCVILACTCFVNIGAYLSNDRLATVALLSLPDGYRMVDLQGVERENALRFYRVMIKVKGNGEELTCYVKILEEYEEYLRVESSRCE